MISISNAKSIIKKIRNSTLLKALLEFQRQSSFPYFLYLSTKKIVEMKRDLLT